MPDKLRIAWFTPFHVDSAVGEFSRCVTGELAKVADVEIWTSDDAPLLPTDLQLVGYVAGSEELDVLRSRDVIIYNLGNYLDYHASIYRVSKDHPGVVILHDRVLHHMFADFWLGGSGEGGPPRYIERMRTHYGEEAEAIALASLRGERKAVWESDEDILRYPLYEEGIENAVGVVTHSIEQARDVSSRWLGPVAALHLPCYRNVLAKGAGAAKSSEEGPVRLLTMGHLNPNKQVHRVIEMLASDPGVAAQVEYRIIGTDGGFTAYTESLQRLIAANGSAFRVELLGWLPDDELEREIEQADIFVNLRHPNIEGGSASLMKQLAYGRPVLCFDSGIFAELPEDAVARVPVSDFSAAASLLRELIVSPERRAAMGKRAQAVAAAYDEGSYVAGLLTLIEESRRAAPALGVLESAGRELGLMGVDGRLPIFDDIANDFGRILAF